MQHGRMLDWQILIHWIISTRVETLVPMVQIYELNIWSPLPSLDTLRPIEILFLAPFCCGQREVFGRWQYKAD